MPPPYPLKLTPTSKTTYPGASDNRVSYRCLPPCREAGHLHYPRQARDRKEPVQGGYCGVLDRPLASFDCKLQPACLRTARILRLPKVPETIWPCRKIWATRPGALSCVRPEGQRRPDQPRGRTSGGAAKFWLSVGGRSDGLLANIEATSTQITTERLVRQR